MEADRVMIARHSGVHDHINTSSPCRSRGVLNERRGLRGVVAVRQMPPAATGTTADGVATSADLENLARRHAADGLAFEWVAWSSGSARDVVGKGENRVTYRTAPQR